jgi:UDP-glucuronate decarboxylase
MKSTTKTILVTGGAGFLGSHLCERLLTQGNTVFCLDNLSTSSKARISHLLLNPDFRFIQHDVTHPIDLPVDEIYNLASPASPKHYCQDTIKTTLTNIQGAVNMLELARKTGAKILQASTSEVYGEPATHPQTESYWGHVNPIGERACYKEAKRCAETLFFDYHRQYGLTIKIARIFNCYGPGMDPDDGRVVSSFIKQSLINAPLVIHGTGEQTRSFCYVDEMVNGLTTLMGSEKSCTGPINLGNPQEHTIEKLAHLVIDLTSSKSQITFKPATSDDPVRRKPDISMAIKHLRWQPAIPLREGLLRTIEYHRAMAAR